LGFRIFCLWTVGTHLNKQCGSFDLLYFSVEDLSPPGKSLSFKVLLFIGRWDPFKQKMLKLRPPRLQCFRPFAPPRDLGATGSIVYREVGPMQTKNPEASTSSTSTFEIFRLPRDRRFFVAIRLFVKSYEFPRRGVPGARLCLLGLPPCLPQL